MEIIEVKRIHNSFTRALSSYDKQADAQHRISQKLAALLPLYMDTHFRRALEIGCGTGGLTRSLKSCCTIDEWVVNDLCNACEDNINRLFPGTSPVFIPGDAEQLSFPGKFDLIASASAFQWMKQPDIFLHKLADLLQPGGILLFSTFAPDNLLEIIELTGKGLIYPSAEKLSEWITADFKLIHLKEEVITLTFPTPSDVLRHLKQTGVTATSGGIWTRGMLEDFCIRYTELFRTNNNEVALTYRPLYIVAVKK